MIIADTKKATEVAYSARERNPLTTMLRGAGEGGSLNVQSQTGLVYIKSTLCNTLSTSLRNLQWLLWN